MHKITCYCSCSSVILYAIFYACMNSYLYTLQYTILCFALLANECYKTNILLDWPCQHGWLMIPVSRQFLYCSIVDNSQRQLSAYYLSLSLLSSYNSLHGELQAPSIPAEYSLTSQWHSYTGAHWPPTISFCGSTIKIFLYYMIKLIIVVT